MKDLLSAIADGGKPVADIEQGHISTRLASWPTLDETRPDPRLGWSRSYEVVGDAEANKLLRRPYRAPWVHPDPATV